MATHFNRFRPALLIFLLLPVLLLGVTRTAEAQEIVYGDSVPAGDTVAGDIFLNGETIRLEGDVDGDVLAIGNTIVVEGSISGSLVAIGANVDISGEVSGSVYTLAGTLDVNEEAQIGHSLYAATTSLGMQDGAEIERDLVGISLGANLAGNIGRETRLIIGPLEIGRLLFENLNLATTGIPLDEVLLSGRSEVGAQPGGALFSVQHQEEDAEQDADTANPTADWLAEQGRQLGAFLLVGLVLLWLRPVWMERWATALRQQPLTGAGIGLVVYIIGFIASLLVLVLFLAITIGMVLLSLRSLGFILGGITLSATGLAFYTFLLFVAFISKIIVAYLVGTLILGRVFPQANEFRLWPFLLGLLIFLIISAIPYLGWAAALFATFFGLGAVWMDMMARRKGQAPALEPAG